MIEICTELGRAAADELAMRSTDDLCRELTRGLRAGDIYAYARPRAASATPIERIEADTEPGEAPPPREAEVEVTWIEIELFDEADQPVSGARFRVDLPDGTTRSGRLDSQGWARVDGIDPGDCEVTFPDLDEEAWSFIESGEEKRRHAG